MSRRSPYLLDAIMMTAHVFTLACGKESGHEKICVSIDGFVFDLNARWHLSGKSSGKA
jgi:hypothetical protein